MKTQIHPLVCCFLVLFSLNLSAQNSDQTKQIITIDFVKNTNEAPKYRKSREGLDIHITNINTLLYNVKFTEFQNDLVYDVQSAEQSFELNPTLQPYEMDEQPFVVFNLSNGDSTTDSKLGALKLYVDSLTQAMKDLDYKIAATYRLINNEIGRRVREIQASELTGPQQMSAIQNLREDWIDEGNDTLEELETTLYSHKSNRANTAALLRQKKKELDDHIISGGSEREKLNALIQTYQQYLETISRLNELIAFHENIILLSRSTLTFEEIRKLKSDITLKYFKSYKVESDIYKNCYDVLKHLDELYLSMNNTFTSLNNSDQVASQMNKLAEFHKNFNREGFKNLFRNISTVYNAINYNNWNVYYQTGHLSHTSDNVTYSILVSQEKDMYSSSSIQKNYSFRMNVDGGLRVNASAGTFFHVGLDDDVPTLFELTDSTTGMTNQKSANLFRPTVGVIMNAYRRSNRNVSFTFNFGVATNTTRVYYYTGFGLLMGKEERIGLTFGAVGGQVKMLKNQQERDLILNQPIGAIQPTQLLRPYEPFRVGGFIGITYTLKGQNKENVNRG